MVGQRTLKNSIRATGVGSAYRQEGADDPAAAPTGYRHRFPAHRSAAARRHPRTRRERRRHRPRHHTRQGRVARLDRRAPAVGLRRPRHRQRDRGGVRPGSADHGRQRGPVRVPAAVRRHRGAARAEAIHAREEAPARRGWRQVGAVRSLRWLQGEFRDRVQSPDLQAPLAEAPRWISPPLRS